LKKNENLHNSTLLELPRHRHYFYTKKEEKLAIILKKEEETHENLYRNVATLPNFQIK